MSIAIFKFSNIYKLINTFIERNVIYANQRVFNAMIMQAENEIFDQMTKHIAEQIRAIADIKTAINGFSATKNTG